MNVRIGSLLLVCAALCTAASPKDKKKASNAAGALAAR